MPNYTLLQAEQDVAALRGQIARLIANGEVVNWQVDGTLLVAGTAVAKQPASSPALAETWHDFPAGSNGWGLGTGGWKKYRLTVDGNVQVSISLRLIGTKTDGTVVFGTGALPSGYQPGSVTSARKILPVSMDTSAATFYGANHTPYFSFNQDGSVTCFGVNATGLSSLDCEGIFSLL